MITIAWDIDDVLNDLMGQWLMNKWLLEHPGCKLAFEQITENTPERIIGCALEEYQKSLDEFRLSESYPLLEPNQEVLAWFKKKGNQARHIALTGVPVSCAHMSAEWLMRNFGSWIRSFNFVPSLRKEDRSPKYDYSKADYLKWLNKIDILVEDSQENIEQAQNLGIKGMLIKRPWNKGRLTVSQALKEIDKIIAKG